jgi:diguanylate cyclase (GGDEF)-like protein
MSLTWLDREQFDIAIPALESALEIARNANDRALEGRVLNDLALQQDLAGLQEDAASNLFLALELADEADLPWLANLKYNIGYVLSNAPDHEAAIPWLEQSLELSDRIGDTSTAVFAHESIADSLEALGLIDHAIVHLEAGLEKSVQNDFRRSIAWINLEIARILAERNPDRAIEHAETAATAFRNLDNAIHQARAWVADWRAASLRNTYSESLLAGLLGAIESIADAPISERSVFVFYDALVDTYRALGKFEEALSTSLAGAERREKYWRRLAEARGTQSARRHQLDHAEAVAKREREHRLLLAATLNDLEQLNSVNEVLVRQLKDQAVLLERQATEDSLTGVGNRRHFDALLERESLRATTFNRPITVALADVDYFKRVNDRFTHQVGDRVLQMVADVMRSACRHMDVIARYGGEEFAFVFPETELAHGTTIAERIRQSVEEHDWSTVIPGLRLTISVGVVGSSSGVAPERLVACADSLLYLAKHRGRNQVRSSALEDWNPSGQEQPTSIRSIGQTGLLDKLPHQGKPDLATA